MYKQIRMNPIYFYILFLYLFREHTNEEKYLQFLKEGVRRAQNYL